MLFQKASHVSVAIKSVQRLPQAWFTSSFCLFCVKRPVTIPVQPSTAGEIGEAPIGHLVS